MGRRLRIGLQISSIDGGYKIEVFDAIKTYCEETNTDLIVFPGGSRNSGHFLYQQTSIYRHINKNNIDSLIVTSSSLLKQDQKFQEQEKSPQAVPVLCMSEDSKVMPCITSEFKKAYRELITHMVTIHKCKKFNIITGPYNNKASTERLRLCLETLAKYNIEVDPARIYGGTFEDDSGYFGMKYFAEKGLLPVDCVISLNDNMCLGVIQYALDNNIKIPQDLKVLGFDDIPRSSHIDFTITTVTQNLWSMSKQAVDSARLLAQGKEIPRKQYVPCSVRFRQSCGCVDYNDYKTDYVNAEKMVSFEQNSYRKLGIKYYSLEHDVFALRTFLTNLNSVQTIDRAIQHVKLAMPYLRVKSCAVVLYERRITLKNNDLFELPSRASLVCAYEEGISVQANAQQRDNVDEDDVTEYITFNPSEQILPSGTFSDRRRMIIVNALFYKQNQFGYVVYEPGNLHPCLYDTLFTQLSTTLNSAIVFTEKNSAEKKLGTLLKSLESTNTELTGISQTDELTGLYNRRALMNIGQHSIDLAIEMKRYGIVVYADMDGLKAINDTYGHNAGDAAITAMAQILKQVFRGQDVIARIGGDEFVVVASGINTSFLTKIRERLNQAQSEWNSDSKYKFKISISIGAIDFDEKNHNLEKLLSLADKEMYKEKKIKKSRSAKKEKIKS